MFRTSVFVLLCSVLLVSAGLKCYICDTNKGESCDIRSAKTKDCKESSGSTFFDVIFNFSGNVCTTITALRQDGQLIKIRDCAIDLRPYGVDVCNDLEDATKENQTMKIKKTHCHVCDTDLCNFT